MDKASSDEKKRKADSRKRPSVNEPAPDAKRPKLEPEPPAGTSASFLAAFDFTTLPAPLITELIVANLEAFTEPALIGLVHAYRQSRGLNISTPPAAPTPRPTHAPPSAPKAVRQASQEKREAERIPTPTIQPLAAALIVKDEPIDPLQMDIDQDELEYEPDRLNEAVCGPPLFQIGGYH